MANLCVNIDHIATLRQARREREPDPVAAAVLVELAGAAGITVHLREDRRHIQDRDVELLRPLVTSKLNLEMAATEAMTEIALRLKPDECTLVPERREELTTEGGLKVTEQVERLRGVCSRLRSAGIKVSLFVDPDSAQILAASAVRADFVELHTGRYARARGDEVVYTELETLRNAAGLAVEQGLRVNAGHGLNYRNVRDVAAIPEVEDLNIGHSIIARAALVGLEFAVKEMLGAIG